MMSQYDVIYSGNDVIHQLTRTENVTLYVSITLAGGVTKYQEYQSFSVGNNSEKYRLLLQGPSHGTLGLKTIIHTHQITMQMRSCRKWKFKH